MKLYEITEGLARFEDKLEQYAIENDGDITEFNFFDELDKLQEAREEKIINIGLLLKNINSEKNALSDEIKNLSSREKNIENKYNRIKDYLLQHIKYGEKINDPRVVFSWRKTKSVFIDDINSVPDEYCKIEKIASKTEIKKAIESGDFVSGAHIEINNNLKIK